MGGPLQRYRVVTPHGVEAVMKLNAADAERLSGVPLDAPPGPEPAGTAPATPAAPAVKARRGAANKARTTAANKAGGAGGD